MNHVGIETKLLNQKFPKFGSDVIRYQSNKVEIKSAERM